MNESGGNGPLEQLFAALTRGQRPSSGRAVFEAAAALAFAGIALVVAAGPFSEAGRALGLGLTLLVVALNSGVAEARLRVAAADPARAALVTFLTLCADVAGVSATTLFAYRVEAAGGALAAGFLAVTGALMTGYTRWRVLSSAGTTAADGPGGIAGREVRLAVLALGVWTGFAFWALVITAAVAHLSVVGQLVRLKGTVRG